MRFSDWFNQTTCGKNNLYIVAEMANAHEGKVEIALDIVRAVASAGANAIKFQCFTAEELLVPKHSMYDVLHRLEMSWQDWRHLFEGARHAGIDIFCDVFGFESASHIIELQPTGFKVHASDVPNLPLLKYIGASGKPILLSTGGVNWLEIEEAIDVIRTAGAQEVVLINGIQRYPTEMADSDLLRIKALRDRFKLPIGYADHVDGDHDAAMWLPFLAVACGARLIEKHVTLDRSQKGTDYYSSMNPAELTQLINHAGGIEEALGMESFSLSDAEKAYRRTSMKSLVTNHALADGAKISDKDITYKRTESGPNALPLSTVIGKTLRKPMRDNQQIQLSDLNLKVYAALACRSGSTRLYAKPLQPIGDRPIIKHLIDRLKEVARLDGVVLAISEGEENLAFAQYAKKWDLPYIIGNEVDVLDRLLNAAQAVEADIILRVTTENPYIYQENLDKLIDHHITAGADLTICEPLPDGSYVEAVTVSALQRSHKFGEERHHNEAATLFIFENPDIFKIERLEAPEELARPDIRLTIDTPEDLMVARAIYEALEPNFGLTPPVEEIIKYLDANPKIRNINAHLMSTTSKLWD